MSLLESPASGERLPGEFMTRPAAKESGPTDRMTGSDGALHIGQRIVLSLLLMALFSEWLYPVRNLMDGDEGGRWFPLLIVLTGCLLLTGCISLNKTAYLMIAASLIAGSLYLLHGWGMGGTWFGSYWNMLQIDVQTLVQTGRMHEVSGESRTLLLLIGWSLLVGSVQMLAMGRQGILLFLAATMLYLLALELALDHSVIYGLIRSAACGLLLQSLLTGYRYRPGRMIRGHLPGALVAISCVLAAWACSLVLPGQPIREISWDRIGQQIERWSQVNGLREGAAGHQSVSGYGRDDSRLGAPLELRREVYFSAASPVQTYWRGESKSEYTGHGWTSRMLPAVYEGQSSLSNEGARKKILQRLTFREPVAGEPIFSGGSPLSITGVVAGEPPSMQSAAGAELRYASGSDALYLNIHSLDSPIFGYELEVSVPDVDKNRLTQVSGTDPAEVLQQELQLPEALPDRVRQLGMDLTAGQRNRYEAVLSVQAYLKGNFDYSLESSIPGESMDFTDFFLFEQERGYCDHFSTAMVVLLRSGGIPARWVKGFAPGSPDPSGDDSYLVSYADAHSWVEVYFPGEGWIPFDPTPGFGEAEAALAAAAGAEGDKSGGRLLGWLLQKLELAGKAGWTSMLQLTQSIHQNLLLWASLLLGSGWLGLVILIYWGSLRRRCEFLLWPLVFGSSGNFPDRNRLLAASDRVWRELYWRYGSVQDGTTARQYLESLSRDHAALAPHLERYIRLWEPLYYGNGQLDRSRSREFLGLCRQLAFGKL